VPAPGNSRRETFSTYYDRPLHDLLFRWIDLRKLAVIRAALADLPPSSVVIDIGCGPGRFLPRVTRDDGVRIAGDLDLVLLASADARGSNPVRIDFDRPLPFPDDSVDGALIIDALEHTRSPERVLSELHRVLRPGGTLIVFTPPYDSLSWVAAEKVHNMITRRASDHISPFTRESLDWAVGRMFSTYRIGTVNLGLSMYAVAVK
jgi:SAM-dependent methyltransferase